MAGTWKIPVLKIMALSQLAGKGLNTKDTTLALAGSAREYTMG